MTNEEKVKEISFNKLHSKLGDALFKISFSFGAKYIEDIEQSAQEMAEWKDQQFKEYLEKKKAEMLKKHESYHIEVIQASNAGGILTIDEIINELFGETESDNLDREE